MDYLKLKTLIETNPDHASISDADMAAWVSDVVVQRDRETLRASEVMDTLLSNAGEWLAMTGEERQIVDMILTHTPLVPVAAGTRTRAILVAVLGNNTKSDLATKIPETVSRATNAGLYETIAEGHIAHARTY